MRIKTQYPITIGKITYPRNTIFDAEWLHRIEHGKVKCDYTRLLIKATEKRFEIPLGEIDIIHEPQPGEISKTKKRTMV